MNKVTIKDLNNLLIDVRALCPKEDNVGSVYIKVKEGSIFVVMFYDLIFAFFSFMIQSFTLKDDVVKIECDSVPELTTFTQNLNLFFSGKYIRGNSAETWVKSVMLLYGIVSYYKAILIIKDNTLEEFELGIAIQDLEMTIFENVSYEELLYSDKDKLFFMELENQKRKKGK